jgi:CHAT domain-containing protein
MNRKPIVRLLSITLIAIVVSIFLSTISNVPTFAKTPSNLVRERDRTIESRDLALPDPYLSEEIAREKQGKEFYETGKFNEAISFWQEGLLIDRQQGDKVSQARILSHLSLAYQQLRKWNEARSAISESISLAKSLPTKDRFRVLAQAFNNQGILELAIGKSQQALMSWQDAEKAYAQINDEIGILRSQINRVNALKSLGMYRLALKTLEKIRPSLEKQPIDRLKIAGLTSWGHILTSVGDLDKAQTVFDRTLNFASELSLTKEKAELFLELGNLAKAKNNSQAALDYYQQGLNICSNTFTCDRINNRILLARFNLNLDLDRLEDALDVWKRIAAIDEKVRLDASLPQHDKFIMMVDRNSIYDRIYLARNLISFRQKATNKPNIFKQIPDLNAIELFLNETIQQAQNIDNKRAEAYATAILGEVRERDRQWQKAREVTENALLLAQSIEAPEITYLLKWQLGRIWQQEKETVKAIASYTEAVNLLQSLNKDLVAIDPNIQFSFKENVEPVYRELVSLLLQGKVSQENLIKARETVESLQLAELNNFFREACLKVPSVKIDEVDKQAAVIYPIILRDRLEVIVSLPQQPLRHYTTFIPATEVEKTIEKLRHNLVIRSQRFFYEPAQKLYQLLITPASIDLEKSKIKTLVFVLDGSLQNIPMNSLYDGKHYLIERYNVALNPGLQLLSPRSLQDTKLKILAAGITKAKDEFSALNYVGDELKAIEKTISHEILLDRDFTSQNLQEKIEFSHFPIIHIATHGQFSSKLAETFLLAWDGRLSIDKLDRILRNKANTKDRAIELLVLSACETASGDKKAALGLAGIAIKAGARSTLATLWSVNDRASAELMNRFYEEIAKKKTTKAEALRKAQLTLLNDPLYKHPFYWSSFILVGNWL